jgi:hypothetical protein
VPEAPPRSEPSSLARYRHHLEATAGWLEASIDRGKGGSCAYFSPLGWSRPYPETSGYVIPTLIALERSLPGFPGEARALALGSWLREIQDGAGWWRGGLHPPRGDQGPSVFNTAQAVRGMLALHELTGEAAWLESAGRAARWLADGVGPSGVWEGVDYRASGTPSYYTYAAAPMIAYAKRAADEEVETVARRVLDAILGRRRPNGTFAGWAFQGDGPAFTHTIAYTLQGLIEAAEELGSWDHYGEPTVEALGQLVRRGELAAGRLPGELDEEWMPAASYVCLTGNAQAALCFLAWDRRRPDLRLVSAAARLLDFICAAQRLGAPVRGVRGAVGGSKPIWGRYMIGRYPNWAAKYHCDALIELSERLEEEWNR